MNDYEAGVDAGVNDHRNGVQLGDTAQLAFWETASDEWKRGWSDGWERAASRPDEDDLDFARDTLGPDATDDEVMNLANLRLDRDRNEN